MKIYDKEVSISESKYKLDYNNESYIKILKSNTKQQSTYNIPRKFFDEAISKDVLVETKSLNYPRKDDTVYTINDDYEFKLGPNVLWLIGDDYDKKENKFVISRMNERKPQIYRGAYSKLSKNSEGYDWFIKLYDKNIGNNNLLIILNESDKTVIFDIEFTSFKKCNYSNDRNHDNDNNNDFINKTIPFPYNRIIFGAPGTGKSYNLNKEKEKLLENQNDYERVTFHPDYSYANFVGTYKPVPKHDNEGNEIISYEYVPGPFMRVLIESLKNPSKPYLLIIEEINRANVAAVFGDIFQLLDRDSNGFSEYSIQTSEDMREYLKKELLESDENYKSIKIPNNMFIWATMNSADQGVFMMDTAFKRRWDFTYIGINNSEEKISGKEVLLGKSKEKIEWNSLRKAINNELLNYKINEDKLLGPFFINPDDLPDYENDENFDEKNNKFINIFKNKVIMYLFEDVAKARRRSLFNENISNSNYLFYSEICDAFDEKGIEIFCENIVNELRY